MKKILLRVVFVSALTASLATIQAHAQRAPLPLGSVRSSVELSSCPIGFAAGMTCFHAEMTCPDTDNLGFTYGLQDLGGVVKGTIVFFSGGGGAKLSGNVDYVDAYLENGFRVVELLWDSAWEVTNTTTSSSIKTAACRPATFLNFVFSGVYSGGGMCAQGDSAGSGAIAYSLAWYGGANFLDKVELMSGPVFGDIEKGCVVPNGPVSIICPVGQFGCNGSPWPDSPAYVGGDIRAIDLWSGNPTCNDGGPTSAFSDVQWKAMSIVDGTNNPSFSYPQTAMAGWLCSNVAKQQNNSAAQGEFFYEQFVFPWQTAGYSLTRIDHCSGTEGVGNGVTPQGVKGLTAISQDMIAGCFRRHNNRHR